ncbi:hypothetical protein MAIT1_01156 [Magnetofaba australis IT-1]|uniref:Uncharacterized protein n=1 Tax=Magnetofaba australis IT-1 TaxID=1434232 RepID=A0A1Y2K842_9PROT|nr:hypothetical protein MAIT1_01156 [Magnetofaba australis IT-1]
MRQFQRVVRAVPHTQATAQTGAEELLFRQRPGRADSAGGQRLGAAGAVQRQRRRSQRHACGAAGGVQQKLPTGDARSRIAGAAAHATFPSPDSRIPACRTRK